MAINKGRVATVVAVVICSGLFTPSAKAFENVNMNTLLSVEGGHLVVRWSTRGFHHYNIRWSENGGRPKQVEREGSKDFRYLSRFRPGVVYRVAVQGCDKNVGSRSRCTSWDEAVCGTPGEPCR